MPPKGRIFLPLLLPTFVLFSAFGLPGVHSLQTHEEVFGSANYYLSLRYSHAPAPAQAQGQPSQFEGELVTARGEFAVRGVRQLHAGRWVYQLQTPQGEFKGILSESAQCPRWLDLFPPPKRGFTPERLQAGECPSLKGS